MPKQLLNYLIAFFNLRQTKPQILLIVELVKFIELESLPPTKWMYVPEKAIVLLSSWVRDSTGKFFALVAVAPLLTVDSHEGEGKCDIRWRYSFKFVKNLVAEKVTDFLLFYQHY